MTLCRLLTRASLQSPDGDVLVDRHLTSRHRMAAKELPEQANKMMQAMSSHTGFFSSVYGDEWKEFLALMQDCDLTFEPMKKQRVTPIDSDVYVKQTMHASLQQCTVRAGCLAVGEKHSVAVVDIPVVSVQYPNKHGNTISMHCWCVPEKKCCSEKKMHCMQSVLMRGGRSVMNPHKDLITHVPVQEYVETNSNASHFDVRNAVKTHHGAVLRDLGLKKGDLSMKISPHVVQCKTSWDSQGEFVTMYLKI